LGVGGSSPPYPGHPRSWDAARAQAQNGRGASSLLRRTRRDRVGGCVWLAIVPRNV